MNRDLFPSEKAAIEMIVDATNLNAVLQALSEICGEKALHIQTNYGMDREDDPLARKWASAEGVIGVLATDKHVMAVSS